MANGTYLLLPGNIIEEDGKRTWEPQVGKSVVEHSLRITRLLQSSRHRSCDGLYPHPPNKKEMRNGGGLGRQKRVSGGGKRMGRMLISVHCIQGLLILNIITNKVTHKGQQ